MKQINSRQFNNVISRLLKMCAKRGYITLEEIEKFFKDFDLRQCRVDDIYDALYEANIAIIDSEESDEKLFDAQSMSNRPLDSMSLYRADVDAFSKKPLLTMEEEAALTKRVNELRDKFGEDNKAFQEARNELINANLRLVPWVAKKYKI